MTAKRHGRGTGNATAAKGRLPANYNSSPADRLISRLERVRSSGPGRWMARCPAHPDRTASLSVREADDGRVLINCFGGCGAADVVAAVGLELSDLFPPREPLGGATGRVPPIDWRGFAEHSRTALTAICLALRDLAAGRPLTEGDAAYLRRTANDLLGVLDSIESAEGRR